MVHYVIRDGLTSAGCQCVEGDGLVRKGGWRTNHTRASAPRSFFTFAMAKDLPYWNSNQQSGHLQGLISVTAK